MKKRILLLVCIALLLLFYSGCNGNGTETGDDSGDEQSTVDYSNDSGFQELFAEIKSDFEESMGDNQVSDMTYEDNTIIIDFTLDGLASGFSYNYDDEKWSEIKLQLLELSNAFTKKFADKGYDVDIILHLVNDMDLKKYLYISWNGVMIYDYFQDKQ